MVLHDITDDAELIEVAPSPFGAKRLLEGDLDVGNVVMIPGGPKERVGKTQDQHVLHQLLPKVVINSAHKHRIIRWSPCIWPERSLL